MFGRLVGDGNNFFVPLNESDETITTFIDKICSDRKSSFSPYLLNVSGSKIRNFVKGVVKKEFSNFGKIVEDQEGIYYRVKVKPILDETDRDDGFWLKEDIIVTFNKKGIVYRKTGDDITYATCRGGIFENDWKQLVGNIESVIQTIYGKIESQIVSMNRIRESTCWEITLKDGLILRLWVVFHNMFETFYLPFETFGKMEIQIISKGQFSRLKTYEEKKGRYGDRTHPLFLRICNVLEEIVRVKECPEVFNYNLTNNQFPFGLMFVRSSEFLFRSALKFAEMKIWKDMKLGDIFRNIVEVILSDLEYSQQQIRGLSSGIPSLFSGINFLDAIVLSDIYYPAIVWINKLAKEIENDEKLINLLTEISSAPQISKNDIIVRERPRDVQRGESSGSFKEQIIQEREMLAKGISTPRRVPEDECVVCLDPIDKQVLDPCGHTQFCRGCVITLMAKNISCPLCKTRIIKFVPYY